MKGRREVFCQPNILTDCGKGKNMRRKDEFADFNGKKKRGNMVVFAAAVLAVCISGVLYAWKLQMDTKYITKTSPVPYQLESIYQGQYYI